MPLFDFYSGQKQSFKRDLAMAHLFSGLFQCLLKIFPCSTPLVKSDAHTAAILHLRDYSALREMISLLIKTFTYTHYFGKGKYYPTLGKINSSLSSVELYITMCFG